jgi:hypothetical protein
VVSSKAKRIGRKPEIRLILPVAGSGKPEPAGGAPGGAAPLRYWGARQGRGHPLKTFLSRRRARAYVTGPRGRTSLAPGASRRSIPLSEKKGEKEKRERAAPAPFKQQGGAALAS